MFGQSKPVVFDPYGRRRTRGRLPRWLLLLLLGIAIGVGGLIFIQERYLPQRLSADAAAKLTREFEQATADRRRLTDELGETQKRLAASQANHKELAEQIASGRATAERLRGEVAAIVASLPPDPRDGIVDVRTARFTAKDGELAYDVVLTRERATGAPMTGVMQLLVAGETARGTPTTVTLEPVALSLGGHAVVRGSSPLPEGFRPRQTTIRVLDRAGGKSLGMRVLPVSR